MHCYTCDLRKKTNNITLSNKKKKRTNGLLLLNEEEGIGEFPYECIFPILPVNIATWDTLLTNKITVLRVISALCLFRPCTLAKSFTPFWICWFKKQLHVEIDTLTNETFIFFFKCTQSYIADNKGKGAIINAANISSVYCI